MGQRKLDKMGTKIYLSNKEAFITESLYNLNEIMIFTEDLLGARYWSWGWKEGSMEFAVIRWVSKWMSENILCLLARKGFVSCYIRYQGLQEELTEDVQLEIREQVLWLQWGLLGGGRPALTQRRRRRVCLTEWLSALTVHWSPERLLTDAQTPPSEILIQVIRRGWPCLYDKSSLVVLKCTEGWERGLTFL